MQTIKVSDVERVLRTTPMRELGIAGARHRVRGFWPLERADIPKLTIKSRDGNYHPVKAAAAQLRRTLMICPFCDYHGCPEGDRFGCSNCQGEGLEFNTLKTAVYRLAN